MIRKQDPDLVKNRKQVGTASFGEGSDVARPAKEKREVPTIPFWQQEHWLRTHYVEKGWAVEKMAAVAVVPPSVIKELLTKYNLQK